MDKHKKPVESCEMSAPDSPAPAAGTVEEDGRRLSSLPSLTRRSFLSTVGAGAALVSIGAGVVTQAGESQAAQGAVDGKTTKRRTKCRKVRIAIARQSTSAPFPTPLNNREEDDYPFVANFSKGLPHSSVGEVDPAAYNAMLKALASGTKEDFEAIPLGGSRKLRNPQSGLAFDLEGPDSHGLIMELVPRIDSAQNSSEMAELYWMALCRDVPFTFYATDLNLIDPAAADLSTFSDYRAPKDAALLFRGSTDGDLTGPYVSQFLLKDIPYGSLTISQRQRTFIPSTNYLTDYASWLANENGVPPSSSAVYDSTPRYIRNGRDLAAYVYVDALYEAYLNACLILLGLGAPFNPGNPYHSLTKTDGFGTFGGPHILSLVTEVATRALKAVWFQKWYVHRRLRPEEFGARIHNHVNKLASYPINNEEILGSDALDRVHSRYGTYLLPQAFPDACPLHPSYGSGHATVAGACITILKAWFDESFKIPDTVVPNADGTALTNYSGGPLTVGGELAKLASNIANGRDFAGIHWRTDGSEGMKLGEAVAIGLLQEQKGTYNESASFTFTKLDGSTITI